MWVSKKAIFGNQIRVNRGLYFHHGIYEDDNHVYQYASPKGSEIKPETPLIITTTLSEFLKYGEVEVREYTYEERKQLAEIAWNLVEEMLYKENLSEVRQGITFNEAEIKLVYLNKFVNGHLPYGPIDGFSGEESFNI